MKELRITTIFRSCVTSLAEYSVKISVHFQSGDCLGNVRIDCCTNELWFIIEIFRIYYLCFILWYICLLTNCNELEQ